MIRRQRTSDLQRELDLQQEEIGKKIAHLKAMVQKAPARRAANPNTMGAPDDIVAKRQTRRIHVAMTHNAMQNTRRELRDNLFLLTLLVLSIAASMCWIYSLLQEA